MTAQEALQLLEMWSRDYEDVTIMCVGPLAEYAVLIDGQVFRATTLVEAIQRARDFFKTR